MLSKHAAMAQLAVRGSSKAYRSGFESQWRQSKIGDNMITNNDTLISIYGFQTNIYETTEQLMARLKNIKPPKNAAEILSITFAIMLHHQ